MKFENGLQKEIYYRSQIDYCYYRLKELHEEGSVKLSPIEKMVDASTGFGKTQFKERLEETKTLIETIIYGKKELNYKTDADEESLENVNELLEKIQVG